MLKVLLPAFIGLWLCACAWHSDPKHWAYQGGDGPAYWGQIHEDFHLCADGKAQSPINLWQAQAADLPGLEFRYTPARGLDVQNNGHTVELKYPAGSFLIVGEKQYELQQFHFHSPSEHQIEGKFSDMVVHLVHKAVDGELAVVAVLLDKDEENEFLTPIFQAVPEDKGGVGGAVTLDLNRLLPIEKHYFHYTGSLTTPPCSEGVKWFVLKSSGKVSEAQLFKYRDWFPFSTRPIQPRNNRLIQVPIQSPATN